MAKSLAEILEDYKNGITEDKFGEYVNQVEGSINF